MRVGKTFTGMPARPAASRREAGSVTVLFGVAAVVVFGIIGFAVDVGRYYNIASKMQDALDASALTGAKLLQDEDRTNAEIKRIVRQNYNATMKSAGVSLVRVSPLSVTIDRKNATVDAISRVKVRSYFGPILNLPRMVQIDRNTKVIYEMKKIELSMVLDITGSMNAKNKLGDLKVAAKDIVDELLEDSINEDNVRIAIAPYSASVNAGALRSVVALTPQSEACGGPWRRGKSCNSSSGQFIDTCVIERVGPKAATDAAPIGLDTISTVPSLPYGNYACPDATVVPLLGKSHVDTLKSIIDGYQARGATAGHIGTAWGWYLLSPEWAGVFERTSKPEPYDDDNVNKSMIVMTDGLFNTSYISGKAADSATQSNDSYAQFRALCSGAKGKGVTIYAVGFDLDDARAQSELRSCASSPSNFYDAKTGSELKDAFKAIAGKLNRLRVAS